MPKYPIIFKIAIALKVSPGWLTFGVGSKTTPDVNELLVSKRLLEYILIKTEYLQALKQAQEEIAAFVVQLINVGSLISSNDEAEKVIDLLISNRIELLT